MNCHDSRVRRPASRSTLWSLGLLATLALAGCGTSDDAAADKRKTAAVKPAVERSPDADLVAEVLARGGTAPAGLRFEITQRPVPNDAFNVRVQVMPTEDVAKLQVSFEPSAGLELIDAAPFFQLGKTAAGTAGLHAVGLRAMKEGVFELRATVNAESDKGEMASSVFSIPVIVSAAEAASPDQK